jgi:hypothetical protein
MFSNTPSPNHFNGGFQDVNAYSSPYTSNNPYSNRKTSMPLMPRPMSSSIFPSPETPEHMLGFASPNGMFSSVSSASPPPDLIPRSQSCSPLLRPYQFSPSNSLYSPYIPSPMSRSSSGHPAGQIDYSLSPGGGQIVHRRNLGVRTKAITPQMAKDGSKRKQKIMKEENASCMTCHHEIATLILHGTVEAIDTRYQVAMNCVDCETKYRLKTADIPRRTTSVDCDCCRRKVAVGGAKVQSMDDPSKWVDPSFGVEVVCVSCRDKYGFCTEVCVLIF